MDSLPELTLSDYVRKKDAKRKSREAILGTFNWSCAYCGEAAESLDHIRPRRRGGETLPSNLAPACLKCNRLKGCRDVWEFFTEQEFYCEIRAEFLRKWMALKYRALLPLSADEIGLHNLV